MNQCHRYELRPRYHDGDGHAECTLSACIKRGGWKPGNPVDYNKATCHAHEILMELCKRVPVEALETEPAKYDPTFTVPQEILDAAMKVNYWAHSQGFTKYKIGPIQNRT